MGALANPSTPSASNRSVIITRDPLTGRAAPSLAETSGLRLAQTSNQTKECGRISHGTTFGLHRPKDQLQWPRKVVNGPLGLGEGVLREFESGLPSNGIDL